MPVPETRAPGLQLVQETQTLSQPRPKYFQSATGVYHRANSNVAVAVYKSARHDGSSRPAHVTDTPAGGDDAEDAATAAPSSSSSSSLPSDFFDAPAEDEEGGRFFGSGVSEKQSEILDFMEEQDQAAAGTEPEKIDAAWLRKKALAFERLITKNAEMRAKFEDEAHKYVLCG